MAGITLAQAQTRLDEYLAAEVAVLAGQSYKIGEREMRRANLAEIQAGIKIWDQRVVEKAATSAGGRRSIIPRPGW
jgi:hypothetical protein